MACQTSPTLTSPCSLSKYCRDEKPAGRHLLSLSPRQQGACRPAFVPMLNAGLHCQALLSRGSRLKAARMEPYLQVQTCPSYPQQRVPNSGWKLQCSRASQASQSDDAPMDIIQTEAETLEATRAPESPDGQGGQLAKICAALASIFPVWVVLATCSAMVKPQLFTWIKGNVMVGALALTMLGMGTTLSLEDLKGAFAMPKQLLAGVLLQYTVMPSLGAAVASLMGLPEYYSVGIILVACCPGGTASNIVTYLARGNVALSVLMTAASTLLAVGMTPLLTSLLAGKFVPVHGAALFSSTLQVVLLPVLGGALANHYFPLVVRQVAVVAPLVAVVTVAGVVGSAVATSAHALQVAGAGRLLLSVAMLHGGGFLGGYTLARLLRFDLPTSRTVAIEVGMQNSVLGVLLASQHFPNPLTAAPCALSSVTHSVLGSLLAACWRLQSASSHEQQYGGAAG